MTLTSGDRPEAKYPVAAAELEAMGYASTVDYLAHCAAEVLRRTAGGGRWVAPPIADRPPRFDTAKYNLSPRTKQLAV